MKLDTNLTGKYDLYFRIPLYLGGLWAVCVFILAFQSPHAALIAFLFLLAYMLGSFFIYRKVRENVLGEMIRFASEYEKTQQDLLRNFVLPGALLDPLGNVLWINKAFEEMKGDIDPVGRKISYMFPELRKDTLPGKEAETECELTYGEIPYRAAMQKVDVSGFKDEQKLVDVAPDEYLIVLYLFDESELAEQARINEENKLVVGIIAIDNYDEALEAVEEVRRSLLLALIDRKVNRFFADIDGLVKKFDEEHYLFVVRKTQFEKMKDEKFGLLEEVKDVNIGNEMAVTFSMGIGLNQGKLTKDLEAAQAAIDMALGRGGDQVIIRDNERLTFFGGHTGAVEKYTRVKARVKAHALREIILSKEQVVIMAHKITDVDGLGAAVGIYRAAKTLGKPAHIVIDRNSRTIVPLVTEFESSGDYEGDLFIDRDRAKEIVNSRTVVVVVDTNRPSYTECRELLDKTEAIVVLDHHRVGEEMIKNAQLSYIEPYASSACEMAAEILQYFDEEVKLKSVEADSLYAGIMVDTNNFNMRTGVRTFEAAAYLRRNGADVTRVRKLFRENLADYRAKAKAITETELFMDAYAISICPSEGLPSPTTVAAQTANELLNVLGVKASFVITEYNGLVYVSARALDEVNVQLIMERLGGGGHMTIAGAQFEDLSASEVAAILRKTIREMKEEGEI